MVTRTPGKGLPRRLFAETDPGGWRKTMKIAVIGIGILYGIHLHHGVLLPLLRRRVPRKSIGDAQMLLSKPPAAGPRFCLRSMERDAAFRQ